MSEYKIVCEAFDKSIVKEDFNDGDYATPAGATIGALAGTGGILALNEWLLHWVKEFKQVIMSASNVQQVKDWYDKTIVDDEAIYWTRKGILKWDYFSRALNNMVQRNDPDWKVKMVTRCNKLLMVYRITGTFNALVMGFYGGLGGVIVGSKLH